MLRWIDVLTYARYGNPEPPYRVQRSDEEWQQMLNPEQFAVTRRHETEKPYKNAYCRHFSPGLYSCVCCHTLLFDAATQFKALLSGWPSFTQPISKNTLRYTFDSSQHMQRIAVSCNVCDAHLGHVFRYEETESSLHYCINSASLRKL